MITLISNYVRPLAIQPTILTVLVPTAVKQLFDSLKTFCSDWVPFSVSSSHTVLRPVSKGITKVADSGPRSSSVAGRLLVWYGSMCQVCAPITCESPI